MKNTFEYGNVSLSKWKDLEWQVDRRLATSIFEFDVKWTFRTDHAGPSFTFSIYKLFWVNVNIHDRRHWDFENNCWKIYN